MNRRAEKLVDLLKNTFTEHWSKQALTDYQTKRSLTYKEMCEEIQKVRMLLDRCGVCADTKIAVTGRNSINWAVSYLSVVAHGSVVVPVLDDFNPIDVEHIINHSCTSILFCDKAVWARLNAKELVTLTHVICLDDFSLLYSIADEPLCDMNTLFAQQYPNGLTKDNFSFTEKEPDSMISLNYTSGTTSLTKGVMLSSRNLIGNFIYIPYEMKRRGVVITRTVCVLPMAHAYGLAFGFMGCLLYGTEVVFLGKAPSPNLLIEACTDVKPQLLVLVPLVFEKIYKYRVAPLFNKRIVKIIHEISFMDKILHRIIVSKIQKTLGGNIAEVIIGGAAFNAHIEKFLTKGGFPFTVGYGMTECAPLISYIGNELFVQNSVGKILDGDFMSIRIAKRDNNSQEGEIQVKGDNVMLGYYKDEEATRGTFTSDGWLKTGDKGYIDKDGNIFIRGRYKSMLLGASGENIYPEAIETKLSSLPLVAECIVVQNEKGKLEAYVYPDYIRMKSMKISDEAMLEQMTKNRAKLNRITARYENIAALRILNAPLPKTPKNTVKRYGLEKYLKDVRG